jgi:hypothetical protein
MPVISTEAGSGARGVRIESALRVTPKFGVGAGDGGRLGWAGVVGDGASSGTNGGEACLAEDVEDSRPECADGSMWVASSCKEIGSPGEPGVGKEVKGVLECRDAGGEQGVVPADRAVKWGLPQLSWMDADVGRDGNVV